MAVVQRWATELGMVRCDDPPRRPADAPGRGLLGGLFRRPAAAAVRGGAPGGAGPTERAAGRGERPPGDDPRLERRGAEGPAGRGDVLGGRAGGVR